MKKILFSIFGVILVLVLLYIHTNFFPVLLRTTEVGMVDLVIWAFDHPLQGLLVSVGLISLYAFIIVRIVLCIKNRKHKKDA